MVLCSTDGGVNWTKLDGGVDENQPMGAKYELTIDLHAVDAETAWIVVQRRDWGTASSRINSQIKKTTDGGATWSTLIVDETTSIWSLHFVDEKQGWLTGEGGVIRLSTCSYPNHCA
ncbi:MAG: hypothetical protein VB934_06220 [Polyangiaceae bacterium]